MRPLNVINAQSFEQAGELLKNEGALPLSGGGDLIGALKDDIFREYPRLLVNLMSVKDDGAKEIRIHNDTLQIGALTLLGDIERNPLVQKYAAALGQAAGKCASPNLRESTTIGGNICQLPRCWYFRKLKNHFDCARKGADKCFAVNGDNRYHSIFGHAELINDCGKKRMCLAVNQSECAPALLALDAVVCTTERMIPIRDFFSVGVMTSTVLKQGELVKRIDIPVKEDVKSSYKRFSFRKSIDFPIINLAISADSEMNYRIWLGGVAPVPVEAVESERILNGKAINEELAKKAAEAAIIGVKTTEANDYKAELVKTLVERELLTL